MKKSVFGLLIASITITLSAYGAECISHGGSNSEMWCDPGSKIIKHGKGNFTLYLKDGTYPGLEMNGYGNLYLKVISDYSGVRGEKDGKGIVYWCPVNDAAGKPPAIHKNGEGGTQKGC